MRIRPGRSTISMSPPIPVAALYAALDDTNRSLTLALRDALCESLRAGASLRASCAAAGIARSTVYRWRRLGKTQPESAFGDFYRAIKQARGKGELRYVACVAKAATEDWRAAAWMLERSYGYEQAQRHEHSGPKGGAIEIAALTPEERRARIAELIAKRNADVAGGD